jgi:hypothetical protein
MLLDSSNWTWEPASILRGLSLPLAESCGSFDPQQFPSVLFKDQGVFPGQSEGYAYLGAGMIVLIAVSIILAPSSLFHSKSVSLWPLWLVAALSFTLAISAKVTLGSSVLLDLSLPDGLERLLSTFRASGRLFWVGYYIVFFALSRRRPGFFPENA